MFRCLLPRLRRRPTNQRPRLSRISLPKAGLRGVDSKSRLTAWKTGTKTRLRKRFKPTGMSSITPPKSLRIATAATTAQASQSASL